MKGYWFILLVLALVLGFFLFEKLMVTEQESPEKSDITIPIEEVPENRFVDVQISYYGKDNRFKLETDLQEIIQQTEDTLEFKGMEAVLKDKGEVIQRLLTPAGWLSSTNGIVQLVGPVSIQRSNFWISMNNVDIDLNKGLFKATGSVILSTGDYQIKAEEMSSDFKFQQIGLKGRPRLTVKKGG